MSARIGAVLAGALMLSGAAVSNAAAQNAHALLPVLPAPAHVAYRVGRIHIESGSAIVATGEDATWIAQNFALLSERMGGPELRVAGSRGSRAAHVISFSIVAGAAHANPESYVLDVTADGVSVRASDRRGLFYGSMTLVQLLTAGVEPGGPPQGVTIEAMHIEDAPRFPWRGVMLDSARHYQTPQYIERFIDAMALLKLNTFQWHLTDDQAWRLEIRKYPRLTQVGAWRVPAGHAAAGDLDPATDEPRQYGGAFSQRTVRSIVRYASLRGITIVPEIDVPGHASAAIAAYPELGVKPVQIHAVPADWGVYPNLFNADETTFTFLTDVLDEVMALFPSPFIHLGGDEAIKDQWKASSGIHARMRALGIPNEAALQGYFITRLGEYLGQHARRVIGWDEILDADIAPDAVVMSWRGVEGAQKAAAAGHDTVLSSTPTLYFDNRQSEVDDPPGRGLVVTLESVFGFDPLPKHPSARDRQHILGLQANVPTEYLRTEGRVSFMSFPRTAAVAEIGWSPAKGHDYKDFLRRWAGQAPRLQVFGITASTSAFDVEARIDHAVPLDRSATLTTAALSNQAGYGELRYTVDREEPTAESDQYHGPLTVTSGTTLRAGSFDGSRRISPVRTFTVDAEHLDTLDSRQLRSCTNKRSLALEDDAPISGRRGVFVVDIMNPCWIYPGVDLSHGITITASVGQVPFNFQIGEDVRKIALHPPATAAGELEVRAGCDGDRIAVLPLAPAAPHDDITILPAVQVAAGAANQDLCFTFTQRSLDPLWVIDRLRVSAVQSP